MENNEVDFYVGRLNISASFNNKFDYLYASLNSEHVYIKKRGYEYGFFNINSKRIDNTDYLIGFLVKYKPRENEEKVDRENRELTTEENRDKVEGKSKFVLQVQSGLIAYTPVSKVITEQTFRNSFAELIEKANSQFFVDAKVEIISKEVDVVKAIEDFDQINEVNVNLHPSNPSNRDIWKEIDDDLHDMKVESYNASYKSKKGMNVTKESKSFAEIHMAADGYGKARLEGEKNGQKKTASTDKIPEKLNSIVKKASEVEQQILDKFKEITDRMKK